MPTQAYDLNDYYHLITRLRSAQLSATEQPTVREHMPINEQIALPEASPVMPSRMAQPNSMMLTRMRKLESSPSTCDEAHPPPEHLQETATAAETTTSSPLSTTTLPGDRTKESSDQPNTSQRDSIKISLQLSLITLRKETTEPSAQKNQPTCVFARQRPLKTSE